MSDQDAPRAEQVKLDDWLANLPFMRILHTFHTAAQPGKLFLGLIGIIVFFFAGWVVDRLSPNVVVGVSQNRPAVSALDAYVGLDGHVSRDRFRTRLEQYPAVNRQLLQNLLTQSPIGMSTPDAQREVEAGAAVRRIRQAYKENFDRAATLLKQRYQARRQEISADTQLPEAQRREHLEQLDMAYRAVFNALAGDADSQLMAAQHVSVLIPQPRGQVDREVAQRIESDRNLVTDTLRLAQAHDLAGQTRGRGVFATLVRFNMSRFHEGVIALVRHQDMDAVWGSIVAFFLSLCWLVRFHYILAIIIAAIFLAVWSIIGGAICRITALQTARDEKIGPITALKFSMKKFVSFFTAPLAPVVIVLVVALCMLVVSILGAIPVVGEIITGVFFGLALVGGFVIAMIVIGVIGGVHLMFPTIAVEGSDGFDAISRAFSYLYSRPWRTIFYTFLAAVYGAICYIFVRFFAFLLLLAVHSSVRLGMNIDGSSLLPIRGKFDAMWQTPTFSNLHAPVNWISLSGSEVVGAVLICMWVCLILGLIGAFVVSYFFSASTVIYFLLRQRVDGTDMEDVYVEEDMEDLLEGEPGAGETAAESESPGGEGGEQAPPPAGDAEKPEDKQPPENPA